MNQPELIRSTIFHTPADPFVDPAGLVTIEDGALVIHDGRISACGTFADIRDTYPSASLTDWRGGYVVPGFVDAHVHFPQLRIVGRLGWTLLDWLEHAALPEERRMADVTTARDVASRFVHTLVTHGTTSAAVFGAHFAPAVAELFEAGRRAGIRLASGLVVSDRLLHPGLHTSPERAYAESLELAGRFHNHGRLLYSVTPRFAFSTSDAMLEVCGALLSDNPTLRCQTHINEHPREVEEVRRLFPWAGDYLAVYERFGLCGDRTILAHNVHASTNELERLATSAVSVAHCPSSNAALGSGIFPFRRHLDAGVRCALGTDVGGGTGFGLLREGLHAHLMQRVAPQPMTLSAGALLHLATRAGARALGLAGTIGDFCVGKAADLVHLRAPRGSLLAESLSSIERPVDALAALFTLGGPEAIVEVRVAGDVIHRTDER